MTTENIRSGAASASAPRPVVPKARPARTEPSWGRVLLNTIELWVRRRLRRGGLSPGPDSRPGRLVKLAVAVIVLAVVVLGVLQLTGALSRAKPVAARPAVSQRPAAATAPARPAPSVSPAQAAAAAWVSSQVSSAAVIGCDPGLCAALQAQGISPGRLMTLGPQLSGLLRTDVIVTPASADRALLARYAPGLIASFGSGAARVEIRAVAPGGAKAYQSAERADLAARKSAGAQLAESPRLTFRPADAARAAAGDVDSRLLATLAALSSQFPLRVTGFGDSAPGAPLLFREVTVASDAKNGAAVLAGALTLLKQQAGPYLPAQATLVGAGTSRAGLLIAFSSPSPLGLLSTVLTTAVHPEGASHG